MKYHNNVLIGTGIKKIFGNFSIFSTIHSFQGTVYRIFHFVFDMTVKPFFRELSS